MHTRRLWPVVLATVTTIVFWGSAFAGIRAGLQAYSPAHLAVLRYAVAAVALGLYALVAHLRLPARRDLPLIVVLGITGFAYYNLALNTGEQVVPSGPAAVLIQTAPIWTALLAHLFLGERLAGLGWLGIAISFCGALIIGLSKSQGLALNWGAPLILSASISMSVYNIIQKRMLARYRPVEITTYALWAGTLLLLPFGGGLIGQIAAAPASATLAIVYLGIAPAALAYVTWAVVLNSLPAGRAASFMYAVPVVAFLVGWVWLDEAPRTADIVGGLLALGGVLVVNLFAKARPIGYNAALKGIQSLPGTSASTGAKEMVTTTPDHCEPTLSIIIPAYNEAKRLPATLERLFDPSASLCDPFEIIVVDDGSTDETRDVVMRAMERHPEIRLIANPHSGKAYTVRTGMLAARGRYCLHADADLSTPPHEFAHLVQALDDGYDGAIGSRTGRPGAPWYRLIMSNSWHWFVSLLAIRGYRDTQCGFKAYRTDVAHDVFGHTRLYNSAASSLRNPSVTAAADVEVLVIARQRGYRIAEVPLEWNHCEDTKIRPVGDSLKGLSDLLKIRWYAWTGAYGHATSRGVSSR